MVNWTGIKAVGDGKAAVLCPRSPAAGVASLAIRRSRPRPADRSATAPVQEALQYRAVFRGPGWVCCIRSSCMLPRLFSRLPPDDC